MKHRGKFEPRQEHQNVNQHQHQQEHREFGSVEEMLRHDAAHTPVPPAIEHRLQASLSRNPGPTGPSWWRRLLGS